MFKLLLHIVFFVLLLHIPMLSSPHIYMPDMLAVILLTAMVQSSMKRVLFLAIIAGVITDVLDGMVYGISALKYVLMMYVYTYIVERTNRSMTWVYMMWAAVGYLVGKYTMEVVQYTLMHGRIWSGSDGYSTIFTIIMLFIWAKFVHYEMNSRSIGSLGR